MPRDDATLLDIAHAARLIQTFIQGMTKEAFLGDQVRNHKNVKVEGSLTKASSQCGGHRAPLSRIVSINGLQADGGTAVVSCSVAQAEVGGGAAPAAEPWALGADGTLNDQETPKRSV